MQHVNKCNQFLGGGGVNAHFQKGKAERRIRILQDLARCQLLHAKIRWWPTAISTCLWPYAIKNVVDILNDTPNQYEKVPWTEVFAKTEVCLNLQHHHHFGVPVYALDDIQYDDTFDTIKGSANHMHLVGRYYVALV
jgi:hypothetical protein